MDLDELYQQTLLDHSKRPRNHGKLEDATNHAKGENPSCGDEIEVFLKVNAEGIIEDLKFDGQGCAISQASGSLMTLKIKGKSKEEALRMQAQFSDMLTNKEESDLPKEFGDLRLLKGVRKFPQRVKCATLAWQALKQSLNT